ncbi:MAG: DUF4856 domain-containing protein [bacterium]
MNGFWKIALAFTTCVVSVGCSEDDNSNTTKTCDGEGPATYAFFDAACASTVAYGGQTARHTLIHELTGYMERAEGRIDSGAWFPQQGEVVGGLDFYFRFDSETSAGEPLSIETTPAALQTTYEPFGSGKDLVSKLAGNDSVTDHKDWSTEFRGWSDATFAATGGIASPEQLVSALFANFEKAAVDRANGVVAQDPDGNDLPLHVTAEGRDLLELSEKFLLVAVAFSQGADDYLDDDIDGKGLLSSNTELEDGEAYTTLAHAWDEGFGYFGAARDYPDYTDADIADVGHKDSDGDGKIDLQSEYVFGAASAAAKRDLAAQKLGVTIDLTGDAWAGFYGGRALIANTSGDLSDAQLTELKAFRDQAISAWERAYMATVIHYMNRTLAQMAAFGTPDYDFATHAKVWSEAKGYGFTPQFNPRSPMSDADFLALHEALGDRPVLATADAAQIESYTNALIAARAKIAEIYAFQAELIGDENGANGW